MAIFRPPPGTYVGGHQPFAPAEVAPIASQKPSPGPTRNDAAFYADYWRHIDKRLPDELIGGKQPSAANEPVTPKPPKADWSAAAVGDAQWSSSFVQAGIQRQDAKLYDNLWQHFQQPPPFVIEHPPLSARMVTPPAAWSAAASGDAQWASSFVQAGVQRQDAKLYDSLWEHFQQPPPFVIEHAPLSGRVVTQPADWSAAGTGDAQWIGQSLDAAALSAAAVGAANWVGQETDAAAWSSAATGAATWNGISNDAAAWTSAGTGDAQWVGASTQAAAQPLFSPARFYAQVYEHINKRSTTGSAAFVQPQVTASADWSAPASGGATWVGAGGLSVPQPFRNDAAFFADYWQHLEVTIPIQLPEADSPFSPQSADWSAAATGAATWVGRETSQAAWTAAATGTATWVGLQPGQAAWSAAGVGGATFVGQSLDAAALAAAGTGAATVFVGNTVGTVAAAWSAAGSGNAIFVPAAFAAAAMAASGVGAATFVSAAPVAARRNLGGRNQYQDLERLERIRKDDEEVLKLVTEFVQRVLQ